MKLHPRVMPCQKAAADFHWMAIKFCEEHRDLTYLEYLQILNEYTASQLKYAIRQERHPDAPEKRGGEE